MSFFYLRAGSESWWHLLPAIDHRFGLGKAAVFGDWTLPVLVLMLAGVWVGGLPSAAASCAMGTAAYARRPEAALSAGARPADRRWHCGAGALRSPRGLGCFASRFVNCRDLGGGGAALPGAR